jgi:hypothetical protein
VALCGPIVWSVGKLTPCDFFIRKSVDAFSDNLLNPNTTHKDVKRAVVDYFGKSELINIGSHHPGRNYPDDQARH